MAYSAGTVFLQVVPSYAGFQEANRKQAKEIAKALEDGLDEGSKSGATKASKNIDRVLGEGAKEAGKKAGGDSAEAFAGEYRTRLAQSIKNLNKNVEPLKLRVDDAAVAAELGRLKAELKELSRVEIKPGMDTREVERKAGEIAARLEQMQKSADFRADMDITKALGQLKALEAATRSVDVKITPDVDTSVAERKIGTLERLLKQSLDRASNSLGDGVNKQLDQINLRMRALRDKKLGIDITADVALRELADIRHQLEWIAAMDPNVQVHVDSKAALIELKLLGREINSIEKEKKIRVSESGSDGARSKLNLLDRALKKVGIDGQDVANSFRFFSFAALAATGAGAALIPILAALSGGAIALTVGLGALVGGLGVLAIGFSGIGNAVKALNNQQDNAGKDAVANGKKMRTAARGVEDAERSLSRARADAAQASKDAARTVKDAQEQATQALEGALRRQEDAERKLADAQKNSIRAQQDLVQARKDAAKELADLQNQQKHNALDERQGVIDVFNATVQNTAAQADPGATNLDKEQAAINLANAQLRLKEIREQGKTLKEQSKTSVDGSQRVKTAQDAVTQALRDQKDAQRDLSDADKELTKTRLDNARNVADAEESLRRTQVQNQRSVSDAMRSLTQAQEDYQTALTQTGDIGSNAMQQVEQAMGALSPAGREFALFIHGLRDDFRALRAAVQEGLLPGVQKAMTILIDTYGPGLLEFVTQISKLFGELAVQGAILFTSPAWRQFFKTMAALAPQIIKDFFQTLGIWMTIFAQLAVDFAPLALEVANGILKISEQVLAWLRSKEGQKAIQDFLAYVKQVAPDVKLFMYALAAAIVAIVKAVAPFADDILKALTSFLLFIATMDPKTLGIIVASVLGMVAAFQALSGILSLLAVVAGSTVGVVVVAIVALIAALVYFYNTNEDVKKIVDVVWPAIVWLLGKAWEAIKLNVQGVAGGILMVGDALKWTWEHILSPIFNALWKLVSDVFGDIKFAWEKILWPIITVMGTVIKDLYIIFVKPALNGIGWLFGKIFDGIKWVWDHTLAPVFDAIAEKLGIDKSGKQNGGGLVGAFVTAIGAIKTIWDGLIDITKKPIEFLVNTVINKGLIAGFNGLIGHFPGVTKIEPIPELKFADGGISPYGVRPGYTPGRDNQIIHVGGGEAILRPELTRALGSDWVYAANKRAKNGGVKGAAQFLQGFKEGGIVDPRTRSGVGEYDRTTWRGHSFNYNTIRLLLAAEKLAGQVIKITQGSYSTAVAASGSTHAGGGAFDAHWPGILMGGPLVTALRMVGFAAWHRRPEQGPWPDHIHGIAIGDPTESSSAMAQVRDYLNGGNGLGGRDDGPAVTKDKSLLDKLKGGLGDALSGLTDAISNPIDWLQGKIKGGLDKLTKDWGDNTLTRTLKEFPGAIIQGMADMVTGALGGVFGGGGDTPATGSLKSQMKNMAASMFGWSGTQWAAIDWLVTKESGWDPNADNPSSTAFGLGQLLKGTAKAYGGQSSDPTVQMQQMLRYLKDSYGTPEHAKEFHEAHGWYADGGVVPDNGAMMYDNGGYLPPGVTTVVNLTGKPEPVFTSSQFEGMKNGNQAGPTVSYAPTFNASDLTADDVMDDFAFEWRRLTRGS